MNTLYQLIGRAGRVGKSYMAKVILIDDTLKNRFVNFNEENIEAKHLEMAMGRAIKEHTITLYTDADMEQDAKAAAKSAEAEKKTEAEAKKPEASKKTVEKVAVKKDEKQLALDKAWEEKVAKDKEAKQEDMGNWDDDAKDDAPLADNWDDI